MGKPGIPKGKGAPGIGRLYIDGNAVGQVDVPLTRPLLFGLAGSIVCSADTGSPVWDQYRPSFKFTATLCSADVSGELIKNEEHAFKIVMARR